MIRISSVESSFGSQRQIDRNLPHEQSERGMLQPSGRIRTQRASVDQLSVADDRPVRHDLVRQIKAQILAGEYDSSAKIEAAAERLAGAMDLLA